MGKLFAMAFLAASFTLCAAPRAEAQIQANPRLTGTAVDTLTNAAADTVYLTVQGPKSTVTFQYNIAKISGTVAGTIKLYGSIDAGANWKEINSHTITDASVIAGYAINYNAYTKYRIIVTTSGTQVSSYDIWAFYRQ